ncbi:MAG: mannose-1-phosphate guanylyltransferase/mannose-6-phosphate isomerase [Deltaproteobacteria bacterium RBG_16_48_10]|nr:MAG: mannose-1-phosphate guanylyltransferase/mannose-6-phosphate isomerase [Deltaproteobacteria bacterium RBG_16_48_10]
MIQSLNDAKTLFAIVLAGGSGTRFWPLSRETCPKQMLQIVGEDTLLRQTIKRVQDFIPPQNIWIVTTGDKTQDIRFHLAPLGLFAKEVQFISEPVGRNTAPAIGLAAICLHRLSPQSVMIVMPSDHAIPDKEKFLSDLELAIQGALEDYLVTFGIKPARPETGYGYIKIEEPLKAKNRDLLEVDRFLEKPDLRTAKAFLSKGGYFWNSGIFVWKTSKILSEFQKYLPSLYQGLREIESLIFLSGQRIDATALRDGMTPRLKDLYSGLESISIDYGIMERSKDVRMVPATFQWSDLGSWAALDEIIERDKDGNILRGNTIDIDSQNSIIFSEKRLIATIGLKDMVVVDTPDATLVIPKERTQEVRKIVEALKRNNKEERLIHRTVERPWGSYTVLEKGERYKIKRIVLNPRARLSLQRHSRRSEHWVVVAGVAKVTRENEVYLVHTNESTFIPINTKHRLENPEKGPLQIIEVQNGEYVEEDDIERFEDDYGR